MTSISTRTATVRRFLRLVAILSLGSLLLGGVPSETAATSLVAVHARGGPNGAIAALAGDDEVVVSRSVGLMEGSTADAAAIGLGGEPIEVSRSVGLMDGARR